jgi:ankyrin repeat protein
MSAAHLCTAVFEGDMLLLKHLIMAGVNVNSGDYDKRTALHIAAADGNLGAVSNSIAITLYRSVE